MNNKRTHPFLGPKSEHRILPNLHVYYLVLAGNSRNALSRESPDLVYPPTRDDITGRKN